MVDCLVGDSNCCGAAKMFLVNSYNSDIFVRFTNAVSL